MYKYLLKTYIERVINVYFRGGRLLTLFLALDLAKYHTSYDSKSLFFPNNAYFPKNLTFFILENIASASQKVTPLESHSNISQRPKAIRGKGEKGIKQGT